ncbi:MAG TPA: NAD-dependent deacylase [bacterium]|nr:NAD-dependent deacylase [bacterium]
MDMDALREAARWLAGSRKTIALTGAGVSTESGIPDFRSASGLWARYNPAEYATLGAFRADPGKVWHMLAEMEQVLEAQPNAGHEALARLEADGAVAGIITQNIDGLHQAAGSHTVVEYHGSNRSYTCLTCRARFPRDAVRRMPRAADSPMPQPAECPHGAHVTDEAATARQPCVIKPDVVFFDEMIPDSAQLGALQLLQGADLIMVAGTSCEVYPASDIPWQVRRQGGKVIEVNLEPAADLQAELVLQGRFSQIMTALHESWAALRA